MNPATDHGSGLYPTLQERLIAIWQEILEVEEIDPGDDFIDLGGHSLHVMQLRLRIRHEMHIDVPLHELFENSALADQIALLAASGDGSWPGSDGTP
jgi:bacitracin synthase 1